MPDRCNLLANGAELAGDADLAACDAELEQMRTLQYAMPTLPYATCLLMVYTTTKARMAVLKQSRAMLRNMLVACIQRLS